MKSISILGSSGSIGRQVKRIAKRYPDLFRIASVCVDSDVESLYADAAAFRPAAIGINNPVAAKNLDRSRIGGAEVFVGTDAARQCALIDSADTVAAAMVGMAGLRAVYDAILHGKDVAIANKETLVTGGELVMRAAKEKGVRLTPIDSEHAAIWQCLRAGRHKDVRRLILTASGGPFRGRTRKDLENVSVEEALRHPTWKMGKKITVDSATMMNKGLEIIEARRLFEIDDIDVIVQPTSVVHSMVEYKDGSVIAQMSAPTMEIPIQLALTDPDRYPTEVPPLDFAALGRVEFESLDEETFGCVGLARRALLAGGYAPTVLNAADEAAVGLFLSGRITFLAIERIIEEALAREIFDAELTVDGIYETDERVKTKIAEKYGKPF